MSEKDDLELDGGFQLTHMVQAQRGLSDLEWEIFLATGQKPDLSQPPPEELERIENETPVMTEQDAAAWLSGATLTASAFFDFDPSHSTSPLYEVIRPKVESFRFDPHQPRDEDGQWAKFPGGGVGTLVKKTASTKKVTPAVIYKKHDDGAVIANTPSGQRMRWDAGSKKYVVEKRQNDKWVAQSSLAKGAAYTELKKPDVWFEPGDDDDSGQVNTPSSTPDPAPINTPAEDTNAPTTNDSLSPSGAKIKPSAIYAKHADGDTVAQSADGAKRMRWDAGRKKFVVENRKDDGWAEESALTKGAAYNDAKNPDKWFEPTETGTENKPSSPSLTPEPGLADTDTTAETPELPPGWKALPNGDYYKGYPEISVYAASEIRQHKDGTWVHEFFDGKNSKITKHDTLEEALTRDPLSENQPEKSTPKPEPEKIASSDTSQDLSGGYPPPEPAPMVDPDWPFSFEPFQEPQMDYGHLARSNDDAYANDPDHDYELKTLPVSKIVPSQENDYEEWGDGLDNDMTGKPFAIKKDGNFYLMDGHHRTAKAGENGSIETWVLDLDKPKEKAKTDALTTPKIESSPLWKPVMTDAEAKDFTADSVVKTPLFHGTAQGADIRENGFQVEKLGAAGGVGGLVGAGHYLTGLESDAKGYAGTGEVLRVAARVKNPVDITSRDAVRSEILKQAMFRKSRGKDVTGDWLDGKSGQEGFENESRRDLLPNDWEKLYNDYADIRESRGAQWPSFVQTRWLQDHGYDGAIWRENGDVKELAVFDDKAVAVIDSPKIPKQADAPEIEPTPATPYVGPTATSYEGASKEATDALRQAYIVEIRHERRVDARATELRDTESEKYKGWGGIDKSVEAARAELTGDAPPPHELADALEMLSAALPTYGPYEKVRRRINYEASLEASFSTFSETHGLGALTPEVKTDLAKQTKDAFAGKKVAVRVSAKTVEHILNDGRFKSQFESGKSKGKKDIDMRASVEKTLFGIDDKPWQNAEKRPIYGYVAVDGIRPAGIGSNQLGDPSTDQLTQYGNVQVVLKDSVRSRTTAMFGDSLNEMTQGTPSPIDDPDWKSYTAGIGILSSRGLDGLDRSGESARFRSNSYAEAQIHNGVSVDDIEEVVFATAPTAALKKQLDDAGIPHRVLNFKTAADGSDEERANALRIAEQDKELIASEIKRLDDKIAEFTAKGWEPTDYTKDRAKYEKQLKTINDALPLLEGTKTSPAKKVAAAKEKVAKATAAPKQADAPKIESTPEAPKSTGTKLSAAEEQELTSLQTSIADLYGQSGYWRALRAEVTHKSGTGKLLTKQDIADSVQADAELKKLRDAAAPLAERELELRMKRDGDLFGEVEDANADRWASKAKPSAVMLPGNDAAKIDKIADSYRVNDKQTTEHNMSLRSDDPAQAALSWRSRMKRMINSQQMTHDAVVYRGAALTPERIMQLRPGSVMIDPGSMSTDEDRGTANFYAGVRLNDLPGTVKTMFEIRAPKGIPVADVEYGEYVFDFETPMRIISTKHENGVVNVIAELVPPAEAKALYGSKSVAKPKASNVPAVNLNAGKKGSIKAKDAKRTYDISFAKHGIQPDSPPQEIYDKAKSTAYFNGWSIMQVLEAIDVIKPGYKKAVVDWVKTPEGSAHALSKKTPTS